MSSRAHKEHVVNVDGVSEWIEGRIGKEIVRCRDCRFCGKGQWGVEAFPVCRRGIHAFQVSNDGFCAWGERR